MGTIDFINGGLSIRLNLISMISYSREKGISQNVLCLSYYMESILMISMDKYGFIFWRHSTACN